MSAFTESGHSTWLKSPDFKGYFRPQADFTHEGIAELRASYLTSIKGDQ